MVRCEKKSPPLGACLTAGSASRAGIWGAKKSYIIILRGFIY